MVIDWNKLIAGQKIDIRRIIKMALYGLLINGPLGHVLYTNLLGKLFEGKFLMFDFWSLFYCSKFIYYNSNNWISLSQKKKKNQ